MNKNIPRTYFSSLAFRCILISIIFVSLPLSILDIITYKINYRYLTKNLFQEMKILQEGSAIFIKQTEHNLYSSLQSFALLANHLNNITSIRAELEKILPFFGQQSEICETFFLEPTQNGTLLCTISSSEEYKNTDFSPYFTINTPLKNAIFIAKNPLSAYSLFITVPIKNSSKNIIGILGLFICLEKLASHLSHLYQSQQATFSLLNHDLTVLTSSSPTYTNKQFSFDSSQFQQKKMNVIYFRPFLNMKNAYITTQKEKHILSFSPFPGVNDAMIATTLSLKRISAPLFSLFKEFTKTLIIILFVGGIMTLLITRRIGHPLQSLLFMMAKVKKGDLKQLFNKDTFGFEINELGEVFNQTINELKKNIQKAEKEKIAKELYLNELQIGHDIQQSILPTNLIPFLQTASFFKPAGEIGGDFYDWIIQKNCALIFIADGSGKGISACLYAQNLRNILRSCSFVKNSSSTDMESSSLTELLKITDQLFCQDTKESGFFVTAFVFLFNSNKKSISFFNCGHLPMLLKRSSKKVESLTTSGAAFGLNIEASQPIEDATISVEVGDIIVLCTDGLTEAHNPQGEFFTMERLINLLDQCQHEDPEKIKEHIIQEVYQFMGGAKQRDDLTLLVFKVL